MLKHNTLFHNLWNNTINLTEVRMKSMNYPFNKLNFITFDYFTNLWKFNGEPSFDWSVCNYINKAVFQRSETRMLKDAYKKTNNSENSGTFGRLLVSLHTFITCLINYKICSIISHTRNVGHCNFALNNKLVIYTWALVH